jgi:DnaK suppressor protein
MLQSAKRSNPKSVTSPAQAANSALEADRERTLQTLKELLLSQRSDLLNKSDSATEPSTFEGAAQGDEIDLAVSEVTLSMTLRLKERQAQQLQKIDRALSKMDEGTFGLCEQCEEHMSLNRLMAWPVATLCLACKEEQESQDRVFA